MRTTLGIARLCGTDQSRLPIIYSRSHIFLAGGASNLIDRFTHGGYVVDFINLGIGSLRTGIFNVADIAITLGVLILLAHNRRQAAPHL